MEKSQQNFDVNQLKEIGTELFTYINDMSPEDKKIWEENLRNYNPDLDILTTLNKVMADFNGFIVIYSASWCKDCRLHVSEFAKVMQLLEYPPKCYVRGGFKKDPLNKEKKWRIPPSPPEIEILNVRSIPTFIVYTNDGKELGRIVEHPKQSMEADLLQLLQR